MNRLCAVVEGPQLDRWLSSPQDFLAFGPRLSLGFLASLPELAGRLYAPSPTGTCTYICTRTHTDTRMHACMHACIEYKHTQTQSQDMHACNKCTHTHSVTHRHEPSLDSCNRPALQCLLQTISLLCTHGVYALYNGPLTSLNTLLAQPSNDVFRM
jgi:hypothetical protein